MSTSKKDAAAQAAARLANRTPRQAETPGARAEAPGAPRTKEVRMTTMLRPQVYRQLTSFCAEVAEDAGLARVPHAHVVRALIARLDADPALRQAIAADVQQAAAQR